MPAYFLGAVQRQFGDGDRHDNHIIFANLPKTHCFTIMAGSLVSFMTIFMIFVTKIAEEG